MSNYKYFSIILFLDLFSIIDQFKYFINIIS